MTAPQMPPQAAAPPRHLRRLGAAAVAATLAIAFAKVFMPQRDVVTAVNIAAPPARVWAVLTDWPRYAEWNPAMRLTGELAPGAVIENREGQGGDVMVFHPMVRVVRRERELRWHGAVVADALFSADHYFLLQSDAAGTRFVQGEHLSGVALWFVATGELAAGFDAMNAALRVRAEAPD